VSTYVTNCEKAGIPAVALGYADQIQFCRNVALIRGVPNIRWIDVPRTGTGAERVATFIDKLVPALTTPLTPKELESGLYTPPPPPRIIFEGTLLDAQEFFAQTTPIANCRNCPIAKYTDGLPIVIPTEEAVKEMLTGTSHKPDEEIYRYTRDATTGVNKKGTTPVIYALGYKTTVEKAAVVAVMAGCKPEYMPAVLAIAAAGGGSTSCPGTSSAVGVMYVVSGPFAKEIGMNAGQGALDVGNPPNMAIGRVGCLMTIDFGGCIFGAVRTDGGNPLHSIAFAEDDEGLPPGWETLREDRGGYKLTESAIGGMGSQSWDASWAIMPSSFRGLIGEGVGGMARSLGVEGIPGPHNFLQWVCDCLKNKGTLTGGGACFVMHLNMAKSLYDYGFKKKADVYKWMYDNYFITVDDLYNLGWWEFNTADGQKTESTSGKKWGELPKDYQLHAFGSSPSSNCIIVASSFHDEICRYCSAPGTMSPIDVWR
jgi:hypothetical protein